MVFRFKRKTVDVVPVRCVLMLRKMVQRLLRRASEQKQQRKKASSKAIENRRRHRHEIVDAKIEPLTLAGLTHLLPYPA